MSGPSTNTSSSIESSQQGIGSQAGSLATGSLSQGSAFMQPLAAQQQALASGNESAAITASMPTISKITGGYNNAQEQIMKTMPPGAGRDAALAGLTGQRAVQTGTAEANAVQQAPATLASLGGQVSALGLQELGASLSGYSGAEQTQQSVMQAQGQSKSDMTGIAGSLAGAGGEIFEGKG